MDLTIIYQLSGHREYEQQNAESAGGGQNIEGAYNILMRRLPQDVGIGQRTKKRDVHKIIRFHLHNKSKSSSLAILSPRLTEILTAGWESVSFLARAVALMPSSRTAQ
jgi:hypothetical protein